MHVQDIAQVERHLWTGNHNAAVRDSVQHRL